MSEPLALRRKRALFRSLRRGTKESDMVMGGFARQKLDSLTEDQLERFEALLDCTDAEVLAWVGRTRPVPPEHDTDLLALLREFKNAV